MTQYSVPMVTDAIHDAQMRKIRIPGNNRSHVSTPQPTSKTRISVNNVLNIFIVFEILLQNAATNPIACTKQ